MFSWNLLRTSKVATQAQTERPLTGALSWDIEPAFALFETFSEDGGVFGCRGRANVQSKAD